MMKFNVMLGAVLASAGAAMGGFSNGDIVFTDSPDDAVRVVRFGTNVVDTLYTFNDPNGEIRLAEITRVDGRYYVNSGLSDADLGVNGRLIELNHLFGATVETDLSAGGMLQNPIGLEYNRRSDQFLSINNTGQTAMQTAPDFDGIIGVARGDGSQTFRFDEQIGDPARPRYQAGARIAQDATNANRYYASSVNGGTLIDEVNLPGGDFNKASALYSVDVDVSGNTSVNLFADFSATDFGPLTFVRGVTTAEGGDGLTDIYITDGFTNGIYHVDLDANGDVSTISQLVDGLLNPGNIIYDRFTDTLVFGEVDGDSISRINLDGSGLQVLATGVDPRGFYIVPAPGAAALFGFAGLAAARRRR